MSYLVWASWRVSKPMATCTPLRLTDLGFTLGWGAVSPQLQFHRKHHHPQSLKHQANNQTSGREIHYIWRLRSWYGKKGYFGQTGPNLDRSQSLFYLVPFKMLEMESQLLFWLLCLLLSPPRCQTILSSFVFTRQCRPWWWWYEMPECLYVTNKWPFQGIRTFSCS